MIKICYQVINNLQKMTKTKIQLTYKSNIKFEIDLNENLPINLR